LAEEKGEQSIIALKFVPEDAWKHLHPQALEKIQLLFNYFNQELSDEIHLKALKFYLANKDDKGLDWLYPDTSQASRPFIDLDLQNNDPQLMVLFNQLDVDITKIRLKWCRLMEKALRLYSGELDRQAEENEKRLAALAKEAEERQAKELEEQRKRAKEKKIDEAYDTLGKPFIADAKRYLPKKDFDEFNESLEEAVDFFLEKDGKYNWDDLPFNYRYQVDSIYHLKALEQKRQDAGIQASIYNSVINDQLADLKKQLYSKKQNADKFFPKETSGGWLALPLASINETASDNLFNHIQYELGKVIGQLAPRELSQFLQWGENKVVQYYRFMPVASYCFTGTGCLDFRLKVGVVAEAELFIKPKTLCFNEIKDFTLPFNITGQISLGFLYRYFPPISVPELQWQIIPLKVILALMEGNITAQGFPLLYLNDEFTTYKVNKDKVTLPQIFIDWLKGMNFQKLHKLDIINKKTLQIIENTDELRPGAEELARKTEGEEPATREYFQTGLSSRRFRRDELDKLWADKPKGLTNDQAVNWALENCHRILYSHI
jgi:hypothetical protein